MERGSGEIRCDNIRGMNVQKKAAVAMSGRVDSAVAAALLKNEGYEVIGLTMDIFPLLKEACRSANLRSCCGLQAKEDASRVSEVLGIDFFVVDLKAAFEETVIDEFLSEYVRGRTPNPCIRCNQLIKFEALWKRTGKLGADFLATGHHARINRKGGRRYALLKGRDPNKDQSYFLYSMTARQLGRTLFPVGDYTKEQVRAMARDFKLPVADRVESQEICFIPDNNYVRFLKERSPEAFQPGPIVDEEGRVLGRHDGVLHFTIGQRRGLGIAAEHPLYVLELRPESRTVVVGKNERLYRKSLEASRVHWIVSPPSTGSLTVKARIRYRHKEASAEVFLLGKGRVRVDFAHSQRAVTPGQAVVFYDGDRVIGGGIIEKSL